MLQIFSKHKLSGKGDGDDNRRKRLIGKLLGGHYRILGVLGEGGFSHTYIAEDIHRLKKSDHPKCVVKHLRTNNSKPEFLNTARRLFSTEAETLEELGKHSQIPRLLAYFEERGEFYLVQEYFEGHSLGSELQPGRCWSEPRVYAFLCEMLEILAFVHSQGVIHRDIKPDNIIRRRHDRELCLIDFGTVKQAITTETTHAKNLTVVTGTPGYIPHEQWQGAPQFNSDIYALGVVAAQALTGLDPEQFQGYPERVLRKHNPAINEALLSVIGKMVRADCQERYQSASEVMQALSVLAEQFTTAGQSSSPLPEADSSPLPTDEDGSIEEISVVDSVSTDSLQSVEEGGQTTDKQATAEPDFRDEIAVVDPISPDLSQPVEEAEFTTVEHLTIVEADSSPPVVDAIVAQSHPAGAAEPTTVEQLVIAEADPSPPVVVAIVDTSNKKETILDISPSVPVEPDHVGEIHPPTAPYPIGSEPVADEAENTRTDVFIPRSDLPAIAKTISSNWKLTAALAVGASGAIAAGIFLLILPRMGITELSGASVANPASAHAQVALQELGDQLIQQATERYQKGDYDGAIAAMKALPDSLKDQGKSKLDRWKKNRDNLQKAQAAIQAGNWQGVLDALKNINSSDSDALKKAVAKLEADAKEGLKVAQESPRPVQESVAESGSAPPPETYDASSSWQPEAPAQSPYIPPVAPEPAPAPPPGCKQWGPRVQC